MRTRQYNKKRAVVIFAVTFSVLMILTIVYLVVTVTAMSNYEPRMFENITEFEKLDAYVTRDLTSADDVKLGALQPVASYTKEIEYEKYQYRVFAYVFGSIEDSQSYYQNCGYGLFDGMNFAFKAEAGLFSKAACIAYSGTCVYRFEGGAPRASVRAFDFITSDFPLHLRDMYFDALWAQEDAAREEERTP